MPQLHFAAQAYQSRSLPLDARRCVNFYAVAAPKDAKSPVATFGCPGLTTFATCGGGPIYGFVTLGTVQYAVSGSGIWRISGDGSTAHVATFAPLQRPGISANTTQILVVDGTNGWVYAPAGIPNTLSQAAALGAASIHVTSVAGMRSSDPLSIQLDTGLLFAATATADPVGTLVAISPPLPGSAASGNQVLDANVSLDLLVNNDAFYGAQSATYYDTYFVMDRNGTNEFFITAPNDGTSISGLDIASAEEDPDNVLSVATIHEQLLVYGTKTIEFWSNVGGANFPFQPIPSTLLQRGLAAPLALVKEDNTIFFLGDDLIFYRMVNFAVTRVSHDGVEAAWEDYQTTTDAFCFSYTLGGHKFVNLIFPSQGSAFVLDLATGLWHERESLNAVGQLMPRWRGNCATQAFGHVLIGDAFSGTIGTVDYNVYTEFDNPMRGLLTSPPIHSDNDRVFMSLFEMYVEAGVGTATGQGSDPKIVLDWSDDGGRTWKPSQLPRSMGRIGEYRRRLRWTKMGQFRNRVLRLFITDPVRRNIEAFYADLKVGMK